MLSKRIPLTAETGAPLVAECIRALGLHKNRERRPTRRIELSKAESQRLSALYFAALGGK